MNNHHSEQGWSFWAVFYSLIPKLKRRKQRQDERRGHQGVNKGGEGDDGGGLLPSLEKQAKNREKPATLPCSPGAMLVLSWKCWARAVSTCHHIISLHTHTLLQSYKGRFGGRACVYYAASTDTPQVSWMSLLTNPFECYSTGVETMGVPQGLVPPLLSET